ncbi:MAG: deaminase [Amycolatopsis sp.]|uniref:RibD family protein n=1 Tax=Amycolatopsis sp. TaxID=37632 RepID=UPI003459A0BD|nr:deaminase [Amycolatopsis sp.]
MSARPYVLLSVAASLDGYIDDTSDVRLLLSTEDDFDRVDQVRAGVDAILVGANTLRTDNPRLLVRSADRRKRRVNAGLPENPVKVTFTRSDSLDPAAAFFTTGDDVKLVYAPAEVVPALTAVLGSVATVVEAADVHALLADLAGRGIGRVLVEGGGTMHTLFLSAGVVDELHLVFAPFFIGDADAPRFVNPALFPQSPSRRMTLVETRQLGDVVLLRYLTGSES